MSREGKKISFSEGGGINIVFGPKYIPLRSGILMIDYLDIMDMNTLYCMDMEYGHGHATWTWTYCYSAWNKKKLIITELFLMFEKILDCPTSGQSGKVSE